MNTKICIVLASICIAHYGFAQTSFDHDFDSVPADESPVVDGLSFFGLASLSTGVTADESFSSPHSMFVVATNLASGGTPNAFKWGVFNTSAALDLSDSRIQMSIVIRTATPSDGVTKHIALQLIDADGTEFQTADADQFIPTTDFVTFSQSPSDLVRANSNGDAVLDLSNIVQYGILYLNDDGVNTNTFYIDDYRSFIETTNIDEITITDAPTIQFVGDVGVTYELESTMDLVDSNNWTSAGYSIEGAGTTQFMFDTTGSTNHKSYRVIGSLP